MAINVSEDAARQLAAMSSESHTRAGELHCMIKEDADPFQALDVVRQGGGELLRFGRVRESLEDAFIRAVTASAREDAAISTDAADTGGTADMTGGSDEATAEEGGEEA